MSNRKYLAFNVFQAALAMVCVKWIFEGENSARMWSTYFLVQLWNLSGYIEGYARGGRSTDE